MRIFSYYATVIFGISLLCFHEVNARLHRRELDATKRIFRRTMDLSEIGNGLSKALGQPQSAQPQGNSANYAQTGAGYSPPPGGSPPPSSPATGTGTGTTLLPAALPGAPLPAAPILPGVKSLPAVPAIPLDTSTLAMLALIPEEYTPLDTSTLLSSGEEA